MLIKSADVIGLKVVTIQEGKNVEDVDDVIYDPQENKVKALLLSNRGIFSEAKVLAIEDVKSIGEDAVLVESLSVLKNASDLPAKITSIVNDNTYLTRTKVITDKGKELGSITDIYFDPKTGIVEEFEVSEGALRNIQSGKKRIKVSDVITVGEDATIVKAYVEEKFEEQAKKVGLQGALTQTTGKIKDVYESAKDQVSDINLVAGEKQFNTINKKLSDMLGEADLKMQQISENTKRKIEEFQKNPNTQQKIEAINSQLQEVKEALQLQIKIVQSRIEGYRKENALGKYLTKAILLPSDKVLARRGTLVTHKLLGKAEENGVLQQVVNNVSSEPAVESISKD